MIIIKRHREEASLVARLAPGGDMQVDFGEALGNLADFVGRPRPERPAVLMILDPGHALPNAKWRGEAAKLTGHESFNAYLAIVTQNPFFKGVLTALSWVRRKHYEDKVVPNTAAAVVWLERMRGQPLPELRMMMELATLRQSA